MAWSGGKQSDMALGWLTPLGPSVVSVADFGCWRGNEPFALLRTLEATEIVVVDRDSEGLSRAKDRLDELKATRPGAMRGRTVRFVQADMTARVTRLPSCHFDLAFCSNTLYQIGLGEIDPGCQRVQDAINEMARVTKPGGWVIAVEERMGAHEGLPDNSNTVPCGRFNIPINVGETQDISSLFEAAGLVRCDCPVDAPCWSYCYRKPKGAA